MGRKVDVDDLVTVSQIAERLGLKSRQNVHWWIRFDPTFPKPVVTVPSGARNVVKLFLWPEVQAWANERGYFDS